MSKKVYDCNINPAFLRQRNAQFCEANDGFGRSATYEETIKIEDTEILITIGYIGDEEESREEDEYWFLNLYNGEENEGTYQLRHYKLIEMDNLDGNLQGRFANIKTIQKVLKEEFGYEFDKDVWSKMQNHILSTCNALLK